MLHIPSTEIVLILKYQHITAQIEQYLTRKHDILQTHDCKGGHIKMTTIIKIGLTFAAQLAFPVTIEASGQRGSLIKQPYEV